MEAIASRLEAITASSKKRLVTRRSRPRGTEWVPKLAPADHAPSLQLTMADLNQVT